jgi:hypothetical protein
MYYIYKYTHIDKHFRYRSCSVEALDDPNIHIYIYLYIYTQLYECTYVFKYIYI